MPAETAAAPDLTGPPVAAVVYIPEPFSEYAERRSLPIVSPPLPQQSREFEPDFDALYDAIVPPEPPWVRPAPRQSLIDVLFELTR